jgi:F-type H+-transporting ATPase subunit a
MGLNTAGFMPVLLSQDVSKEFLIQSYYEFNFLGFPVSINTSQVTTVIVMGFILILALIARRAVLNGDPDNPGMIQNVTEMLIEFLDGLVLSGMGKRAKIYRNFILTLMIFICISNISGIFGLRPPTADFAVTFGMGIIVFFIIQYVNFKNNGFGAITGLFQPIPVLFPINLIGEFANPISLSLRLFGNVVGGTIMLGLYYGLMPWFARLGIPAFLHAYLDLFSGVIQTYVFAMLTMVWITDKYGD